MSCQSPTIVQIPAYFMHASSTSRSQKLAEGWTIVEDAEGTCPQCEQVLMKDNTAEQLTWCVQCNQRVMTETDLLAELENTRRMTGASTASGKASVRSLRQPSAGFAPWPSLSASAR